MKKQIILLLLACMPFIGLMAAKADKQTVVLSCDLHCQGCCDKVMKNIAFEKGVKDIVCDLKAKTVTLTYDANKTSLDNLLPAFERIGKPAKLLKPSLQAGTVVRDTILGVPCCVYLPDRYAQRAPKEVFPVLYLHHGMFGNENDWTEKGALVSIMDSLLQLGAIKEWVVIMPDNCPGRPTYEEEKTNATTGEWENNFARFMFLAESRYSISKIPAKRAVAGLSMGGYHTMRVASVLKGEFAYIGMFSSATFEHNAPKNYRLFWIGIGKEDFLYESLQDYRRWLDANGVQYTYYETGGGHDWPNWKDYICRFLQLISQ